MPTLNVLSICGSLRKGSYNAIVQRALPSLAPEGMTIKPAPSFAEFPLYNATSRTRPAFRAGQHARRRDPRRRRRDLLHARIQFHIPAA
jgi:chromate reductase